MISAGNFCSNSGKQTADILPVLKKQSSGILKPEAKDYTLHYTIKPDQWMGLYFNSFGGKTELESVLITRE